MKDYHSFSSSVLKLTSALLIFNISISLSDNIHFKIRYDKIETVQT